MFRFVLLTSLGVIVVQPAFAQQTAPTLVQKTAPVPAQMTPNFKPASSIALSSFALAQRDGVREMVPQGRPNLQASLPTAPQRSSHSASPLSLSLPQPEVSKPGRNLTGTRPVATTILPLQPPPAVPVFTVPVPVPVGASAPQPGINPLYKPRETIAKTVLPSLLPPTQPKILASREAIRQRMLLSQLDADLAAAQPRLNRAQARLSESQHQLGAFTTTLRSAMLEAGDEGSGLHPFVRVAQRYLGTPYVWGGESARGFDCSGFIMRVMRDLGYRALPHSAAEQFHYGTPVARELLKPGDIVFFANTYKPGVSHVGIYLGRGRFIHAANSKVGTIVSSINEPKWVQHYAGARRLIRADA